MASDAAERARLIGYCRQDGMCSNVYWEQWDAKQRKYMCTRLPNTQWCLCSPDVSLFPCRNCFLCQRYEVPATVLTQNEGRCRACAENNIFLVQSKPLPRPSSYWECPGCRMHKRQICVHPACKFQHAFCIECARQVLLLGTNAGKNRGQCPLCQPLFDMGKM